MKIGVLALQGDFEAHQKCLENQQVEVIQVRNASELEDLDGIVLPGGESTAISRLMVNFGLFEPLKKRIQEGLPTFATCAGTILLAQSATPPIPAHLGLFPIHVERNGYGPQTESSLGKLLIPEIASDPITIQFIRAPIIKVLPEAQKSSTLHVYAHWKGTPALLAQDHILAATFHPELDPQTPVYSFWLNHFVSPNSKGICHEN